MEHVPISPRPELPFEERIDALERSFSGRLGFHAVHVERGDELGRRKDEPFPTASVIKVAVCCAVLQIVADGYARLGERLPLPPVGGRVAGGGILKQLEVEDISLRDAIELMITLSDNVATNVLLDRIGVDAVNVWLDGVGLEQTRLLGPVNFQSITHDLSGGIGVSTPREQTKLLLGLARGELLTPELTEYLIGVLGRQHYQDQIPRWLPWNPYAQYHEAEQPLTVANKTGELNGIRADAGLLRHSSAGTVALAVFTDGGTDMRESLDVEGSLAVAECGAAVGAQLLGLDV